jgi:hypothetical protein
MTRKSTAKAAGKPNPGQFRKGRRPHNKISEPLTNSLSELIQVVGNERRKVRKDGIEVEMSLQEATLRRLVEEAVNGKPQAVKEVVRLMQKYPAMTRTTTERVIITIRGALANV